ncbi:MAG TPA: hypothetical protein VFD54_16130 [Anaerolineales bacterium]|nr:hypothetical protein [Anaerolineales bacterium]
MDNNQSTSRSFWLTIIIFTFIANLATLRSTFSRLVEIGANLQRATWSGVLILCFGIMVVCIWLAIYIIRFNEAPFNISSRFSHLQRTSPARRALGWVVFLAILILIPYIKFRFEIGQDVKNPVYDPILMLRLYYWLCFWMILLSMAALKAALQTTWQLGLATALVLLGVAYELWVRFSIVTTYPLSMGWSEGSRYYYASLYFSKWIYGESFPLSTLHPTRYLLQSIPFLMPELGLAAHRFWQFLLWVGLTSAASIVIAKRAFPADKKYAQWLVAGWLFLFLLRVGVYYHLEVMVIIPLLFVSAKHPWRSLVAVIVASIWAGISRVNWFPMPAMITTAIYLLETPFSTSIDSNKPFNRVLRYLAQPALWLGTGLLFALFAQFAYIPLSGNAGNEDAFTSSFTSDLLWYRLWPNQNHAQGILPAILIMSGPLLVIIFMAARRWNELHSMRWLGLFSMILVLFAGSLVVSTKIGGGGDLHNMDTYAVLVGILAAYFVGGQVKVESGGFPLQVRSWPILITAMVIPLLFLVPLLSPHPNYDDGMDQQAYGQLTQAVNEAGRNGPVLFINERQLIALGDVHVPLVYDYEVVTLMEMAMSGNQVYLNRFYDDLAAHRFAAIVATKQNLGIKEDGAFFEENNVWNTHVSPYILCYYTPALLLEPRGNRIEFYVPSTEAQNCPASQ